MTDQNPMRLFCFPPAGGFGSLINKWEAHLPAGIQLVPVCLPGQGKRYRERPIASLSPLIDSLLRWIQPQLPSEYAFFGHSMGGLVCLELARNLIARGVHGPSGLFVSGCEAPDLFDIQPKIHNLPAEQFITRLRQLNGVPPLVLENPELMELLLPSLRADFTVCETYKFEPGPPLSCSITAFGGDCDPEVTTEGLRAWRRHTTGSFNWHMYPGDHFYLIHHWPSVAAVIGDRLAACPAWVKPCTAEA